MERERRPEISDLKFRPFNYCYLLILISLVYCSFSVFLPFCSTDSSSTSSDDSPARSVQSAAVPAPTSQLISSLEKDEPRKSFGIKVQNLPVRSTGKNCTFHLCCCWGMRDWAAWILYFLVTVVFHGSLIFNAMYKKANDYYNFICFLGYIYKDCMLFDLYLLYTHTYTLYMFCAYT